MADMKDFYPGDISNASMKSLKDTIFVSEPCTSCRHLTICGGRCLYANIIRLWGNEGFSQVSGTVTNLIEELYDAVPQVKSLIETGKVQRREFEYPKFNGCEIIP